MDRPTILRDNVREKKNLSLLKISLVRRDDIMCYVL